MAESVDALVSNTSGATRAGSTPALGTTQKARYGNITGFFLLCFFELVRWFVLVLPLYDSLQKVHHSRFIQLQLRLQLRYGTVWYKAIRQTEVVYGMAI
jgi:hypothetical protein